MKLHIAALVILTGLSCSGLFAQSVLPDSVYVHITTNGHYTMLANANNVYGQGETVDITSEYYIGNTQSPVRNGMILSLPQIKMLPGIG